ncbi:enoyl-CoA hydratase/isomerase family protein [Aeromicrobium sp. YIM 150415]|uniref:enoyl-CoA hydratase/isomerase family protein n=1 Tax=Aeromicrobium sp. YIM 150415 TaxID=2803912 RepID=UPI00196252C5|nr:enoyl-CoA hydratase/isomerase family protein [Aeromicrobium sp. YIM 150415]MBM9463582.1 enoyl-CoA hydratase/isomerase family protein [Aeromicrobium sp. YIM 150415]
MDLEYSVEGQVATIRLNRPHLKNAFTFAMLEQWTRALEQAQADDEVRAVVLTGAGGAFCSGVELSEIATVEDSPLAHKHMLTRRVHTVARAVEQLDKPLIAAIDGVAVGAGMDMALMCDMRFVSPRAKFSEGYVKVGLVPGDGGCFYLPRIVGEAKALELLMTGDLVDGEEALRIGLATKLFDPDELLPKTYEFARRLAEAPPAHVQLIKSAVRRARTSDLATSLDLISSHMGIAMATKDHREAMRAFRERRQGHYEGA